MPKITAARVRAYFDSEAAKGGARLPDPETTGGLGTYVKYEQAVTLMADPAVTTVLDVGCNRGQIELLFHTLCKQAAVHTHVEGVDISTEAIRQARELDLPNCSFQSYDGGRLPFPEMQFDLVVLVEVIEHVADPLLLLTEIHRVLRPGGRLYLTTPNPECVPLKVDIAMWDVLRWLWRRSDPHKDAFLPRHKLVALLADAGFGIVGDRSLYSWPHLYVYLLGWSIFPPLPPRALFHYQRLCVHLLERRRVPEWIGKRFKWTLVALAVRRN
ncbi:MAG: class I SAM-dependent methyltransferase [Acidobacteriota bacterium]|nr:class I SAM-dependent methyltransferase [Acidobacteriota bacterium]